MAIRHPLRWLRPICLPALGAAVLLGCGDADDPQGGDQPNDGDGGSGIGSRDGGAPDGSRPDASSDDGSEPNGDAGASGPIPADTGTLLESDAQLGPSATCGQAGATLRVPDDEATLMNCSALLGSLAIERTALTSLDLLQQLRMVHGTVTIAGNAQLTQLAGLERLETVGGALEIRDNPRLVSTSMRSLRAVGGSLSVVQNDALNELAMPSLSTVEVLHIEANRSLSSLAQMLPRAERAIVVIDNPQLSDADAYLFASTLYPDREVTVMNNRAPSATPMRECGVAGEFVEVRHPDLAGCTHLRGSLHLRDSFLPHLRALGNLRKVGEDVIVFRPHRFVDLRGFDNLESVGGALSITHAEKLETLDGASKLRTVGSLRIDSNYRLRSVAGLAALESVAGNLNVADNAMLPQAAVQSFADGLMVGGEKLLGDNGS